MANLTPLADFPASVLTRDTLAEGGLAIIEIMARLAVVADIQRSGAVSCTQDDNDE